MSRRTARFVLHIALNVFASVSLSQTSGITTYCNPIDIDYKYIREQVKQGISYRAGADPVIVTFKGEYYLFSTVQGGWWHSKDLLHWNFIVPDKWPEDDMCAPAATVVRDTLYLFQSTFGIRPLFATTTPWNGHLDYFNPTMPTLSGALGPWDPDIFHDEATDRWFMYFGSSNFYPIYGVELDPSQRLGYKGSAVPLLALHPDVHGWERFGQDHRDTTRPYIEGAWMTKYAGKYYLQYAAPGTEYNAYANGTYVGETPLGPFVYAPNNPVSYKPGGFMCGAGHGNTFQDIHGNYWNTGTPWVAVNWNFERRIAMFPAGFDADGLLFSNTRFGDFPQKLPREKWVSSDSLFAGWMLLSYRKPATSTSLKEPYSAGPLTDENPRTFWVAAKNRPGEGVTIDLQRTFQVYAVQVNFTDYEAGLFFSDSTVYTQFRLYASVDEKRWSMIADLTEEKRDRPNAYIELPLPVQARYIKYEHVYVGAKNLAISDIRVFGHGSGPRPQTPGGLSVVRDADQRNAFVSWKPVENVVGYNLRWGIRPDKLYQTYQVFADRATELELRALTMGQEYFFAIEAFNEIGVSGLSPVVTSGGGQ